MIESDGSPQEGRQWGKVRLGYLVDVRGGMTPDKSNVSYWEGDIPWVSPKDMKSFEIIGSIDHVSENALNETGLQMLPRKAVLIVIRGMILDHTIPVGICRRSVAINQDMKGLIAGKRLTPQFLAWSLVGHQDVLLSLVEIAGHGTCTLRSEQWQQMRLPLPPLPEQKQIAAFLDYETAKIDALIEQQQQLIALLGEKRQAVISHAVTKGLNPDAPMRDSGIEWLGAVPEHWEISRAKFVLEEQNRAVRDCDEIVTSFRDGQVCLRARRRSTGYTMAILEHGYQGIRRGDLVVHSMDAFAGAIGVSEDDGRATPEYVVVKPFERQMNCNYFAKILRVMAERDFIFVLCPSVRERAPRFRFARLQEVRLPIPPSTEQDEIVDYLASVQGKLDGLQVKAEHQVELLQERRTALISAAVTGKIDVRGWKPPSSDAKPETEMEVA